MQLPGKSGCVFCLWWFTDMLLCFSWGCETRSQRSTKTLLQGLHQITFPFHQSKANRPMTKLLSIIFCHLLSGILNNATARNLYGNQLGQVDRAKIRSYLGAPEKARLPAVGKELCWSAEVPWNGFYDSLQASLQSCNRWRIGWITSDQDGLEVPTVLLSAWHSSWLQNP